MGYQRGTQKRVKTSDRQLEPSTQSQHRDNHPVEVMQEMFGSRAASRQLRAGDGVANLVARSLSPVSPRVQVKPLFRGVSQDWGMTPPATGLVVQPKLAIGAPNDRCEQEADRVAEQVVQRLHAPAVGGAQPHQTLQRDIEPDDEELRMQPDSLQRDVEPDDDELQRSPLMQQQGGGAISASGDLETAIQHSHGSGQPLTESIRKRMEQAFGGVDFRGVKVHTDSQSDKLNRSIQAKAFTTRQDIYFRQGAYEPASRGGQELIAHELTHVVQQNGDVSQNQQDHDAHSSTRADGYRAPQGVVRLTADGRSYPIQPVAQAPIQMKITANVSSHPLIQRVLYKDSKRAFEYAKLQNREVYESREQLVDGQTNGIDNATKDEQKEICNLRGAKSYLEKSSTPEKRLKDYIRAYLLWKFADKIHNFLRLDNRSYAQEVAESSSSKEKVKDKEKIGAKKKDRRFYYEKALEQRDKYKVLLQLGVNAPATKAFLTYEGFSNDADILAVQSAKNSALVPKIDVRSTYIGKKVLGMNRRAHLFIVYTDEQGKQLFFRGGPSNRGDNPLTIATYGEYTPDTIDFDPSAPSVTLLKGNEAKDKLPALIEATKKIDGMKVPYVGSTKNLLDGQNCNSVVWTILTLAAIEPDHPPGHFPGWNHMLGSNEKSYSPFLKTDYIPDRYEILGTYILPEPANEKVKVYPDQHMMGHTVQLPGQTKVSVVEKGKEYFKIIYGSNQVGYIPLPQIGTVAHEEDHEKGPASADIQLDKLQELCHQQVSFTLKKSVTALKQMNDNNATHIESGNQFMIQKPDPYEDNYIKIFVFGKGIFYAEINALNQAI